MCKNVIIIFPSHLIVQSHLLVAMVLWTLVFLFYRCRVQYKIILICCFFFYIFIIIPTETFVPVLDFSCSVKLRVTCNLCWVVLMFCLCVCACVCATVRACVHTLFSGFSLLVQCVNVQPVKGQTGGKKKILKNYKVTICKGWKYCKPQLLPHHKLHNICNCLTHL